MSKARIVKPTAVNPQTGKKNNPNKGRFFKEFLAGLKTCWNNQQALDQAENKKWYVAVIVCFFMICLSIIPMIVQSAKTEGAQFLENTILYNYDEGFYSFLEDAKASNYDIVFDKDKAEAQPSGIDVSREYTLVYEHKSVSSGASTTASGSQRYIDFQVYFVSSEDFGTIVPQIRDMKVNTVGGRDASFIAFGRHEFATYLFSNGNYTAVGGTEGDYLNLEKTMSLRDFLVTSNSTRIENSTETLTKFKGFVNDGYINLRKTFTFLQSALLFAVNFGVTLLMGLIVFLMTRGKNNPNRGMKFQTAFNTAYWCSTGPAVLALAGGFLFKNAVLMIYVMLFGFRIMWLSMKSLSPNPAN